MVSVPVTAAGVSSRIVIPDRSERLSPTDCAQPAVLPRRNRHIFFQFNSECLAVAAQAPTRTHKPSTGITEDVLRIFWFPPALSTLRGSDRYQAVCHPRNQATRQRHAKVIHRQLTLRVKVVTLRSISRIAEDGVAVHLPHGYTDGPSGLITHAYARTTAGSGLVGCNGHPINKILANKPPNDINIRLTVQLPPTKS